VGDICQLIGFYADARATDEGRSPFVKQGGGTKIGEKIMDERLSIYADPFDPQVLAQPFDGDGLPLGRQVFIENGVLKTLYYSRFWAQKKGVQPTGAPTSFLMSGGTTSLDDMIKSTDAASSSRVSGTCAKWTRARSSTPGSPATGPSSSRTGRSPRP
jgi:predicted Zn-dependent protease